MLANVRRSGVSPTLPGKRRNSVISSAESGGDHQLIDLSRSTETGERVVALIFSFLACCPGAFGGDFSSYPKSRISWGSTEGSELCVTVS